MKEDLFPSIVSAIIADYTWSVKADSQDIGSSNKLIGWMGGERNVAWLRAFQFRHHVAAMDWGARVCNSYSYKLCCGSVTCAIDRKGRVLDASITNKVFSLAAMLHGSKFKA